jgi:hypothetical protein
VRRAFRYTIRCSHLTHTHTHERFYHNCDVAEALHAAVSTTPHSQTLRDHPSLQNITHLSSTVRTSSNSVHHNPTRVPPPLIGRKRRGVKRRVRRPPVDSIVPLGNTTPTIIYHSGPAYCDAPGTSSHLFLCFCSVRFPSLLLLRFRRYRNASATLLMMGLRARSHLFDGGDGPVGYRYSCHLSSIISHNGHT